MKKTTAYQKVNKRQLAVQSRIRVRIVAGIVALFFLTGLIIPLRPKVSHAEFPKMSVSGLTDGSYFTEIETWYTETYPLREIMTEISERWQKIYGITLTETDVNAAANKD